MTTTTTMAITAHHDLLQDNVNTKMSTTPAITSSRIAAGTSSCSSLRRQQQPGATTRQVVVSTVLMMMMLLNFSQGFVAISPQTKPKFTHQNQQAIRHLPTLDCRFSSSSVQRGRGGGVACSALKDSNNNHDNRESSLLSATKNPFLPDLPFSSINRKSNDDDNTIAGGNNNSGSRLSLILFQAKEQVFQPLAQSVDDATDGWALNYADLSPETESTPLGQAFLATNIAYAAAGVYLSMAGETTLGILMEIVSVASFTYHYTQLQKIEDDSNGGSSEQDMTVRAALLVDYVFALTSILLGLVYVALDQQLPPMEGLISATLSLGFLFACWTWERGMPYIVLHSLWHFFSAYTGYVIGNSHIIHTTMS